MKKENYILLAGVLLCGLVYSPTTLDNSLEIRHIIWGLITLALCACVCFKKKKEVRVFNTTACLFLFFYCMFTALSFFNAPNKAVAANAILTTFTSFIFLMCTAIVIDKKIIMRNMMIIGLSFAMYGAYELVANGLCNATDSGFNVLAAGRNLWSSVLLLFLPFALYEVLSKRCKIAYITIAFILFDIAMLSTRSVIAALVVATSVVLIKNKKVVIAIGVVMVLCVCISPHLRNSTSLISTSFMLDHDFYLNTYSVIDGRGWTTSTEDEYLSQQYSLEITNTIDAWTYTTGTSNIIIAIIDLINYNLIFKHYIFVNE